MQSAGPLGLPNPSAPSQNGLQWPLTCLTQAWEGSPWVLALGYMLYRCEVTVFHCNKNLKTSTFSQAIHAH